MLSSKNHNRFLSDEEVRKLVTARLSILSPDTIVSLGSDGSFTRDQLIDSVKKGDEVGEKMAEIQMEWLRSFKEAAVI